MIIAQVWELCDVACCALLSKHIHSNLKMVSFIKAAGVPVDKISDGQRLTHRK